MPSLSGDAGDLLSRCDFPAPGEGEVALAVSGGPDSLALIVLAAESGLSGRVLHVDHGLRARSGEDAPVVAGAATRFGFGFELLRVDVSPGPDLEARARRARYQVLPAGVLTGHTLDDQAETVLLNLMRGAGLDGLAGMRQGSPTRVRRPLLGLRRRETAALCRSAGLIPVLDETNADPRFRRNRVRSEVLPLLDDVAGRDVAPVIARQAALLAEEADLLDTLAAAVDPTDAKALRSVPVPVARRSVRAWLRDPDTGGDAELHPPSLADVERVLAVASGRVRACELPGGRRVQRSLGRLKVSPPDERPGSGR
jgi:tRNA(Ile)-lysidine synthase